MWADGIRFDSRKEGERYMQLKLMEKAGEISDLRMQVKYTLVDARRELDVTGPRGGHKKGRILAGYPGVSYIADFVYVQDGELVVEDVKGFQTDVYKVKKQLMAEKYGIFIHEV